MKIGLPKTKPLFIYLVVLFVIMDKEEKIEHAVMNTEKWHGPFNTKNKALQFANGLKRDETYFCSNCLRNSL